MLAKQSAGAPRFSEIVRAAARTDLKMLAVGGGFILAPGCALPYWTPDENIRALVETAHADGRYD